MGRRSSWSAEMVDAALQIVRETKSADKLRKAMSVVLSGVQNMTLPQIAEVIGRSRATVARYHAEFRAWWQSRREKAGQWGGRRRAYLTLEEEKEFVSRFFDIGAKGGMLIVSEVWAALEKELGHKVAETTVYRMLARHGWRKIVPRRRHPKADELAQDTFKKNSG